MAWLFKKSPAKRFWLKLLLLALPFVPMVILYFVKDPFMKLYPHKRFDQTNMLLDEAFVGWQNIQMNRDSLHYDSFILGNSCTMAFRCQDWEKHLGKDAVAARFFDNAESLGGICQKIEALDSVGLPLHNLLIIVDRSSFLKLEPLSRNQNLFSAKVAGISEAEFQLKALQDFLYPSTLIPYFRYIITGRYVKSMRKVIHDGAPLREAFTNNFINPREKEIEEKGEGYWTEHKEEFEKRPDAGKEETPVIEHQQILLLRRIRKICDKQHTRLVLLISPDYYQTKLNHQDLLLLKKELGNEAVWDFTGVNEYTRDLHNYYEPGHYRPMLGRKLLDVVYSH